MFPADYVGGVEKCGVLLDGCSTRVANELGAGDAKAAKQAVMSVVCLSASQALVVSSILMALRHHWGWLFSGDAEVVDTVAGIMPFIACVALLDGVQGVLSGKHRSHSQSTLTKNYLCNHTKLEAT